MIMHLHGIFLPRFKLNYSILLKITIAEHKFNTEHNSAICLLFHYSSFENKYLINLTPKQTLEMQVALWATRFKVHVPFLQNVDSGTLSLGGSHDKLPDLPCSDSCGLWPIRTQESPAHLERQSGWKAREGFLDVLIFTIRSHIYDF